jgi:phage tail protein X
MIKEKCGRRHYGTDTACISDIKDRNAGRRDNGRLFRKN